MDNDRLLEQLKPLFDKQLSAIREHVDEGLAKVRQDNLRTNERITKQSQLFHDDQTRLNNRLDLVAAQVAKVGDAVVEVKEIVSGHSEDLDKLQRRVTQDLDRLDDQGKRIEAVEAKTSHLTTPPHS